MATTLHNPERWRLRADEMRKLADAVDDPESKQLILDLASSYEKLATRAEERIAAAKKLTLTNVGSFTGWCPHRTIVLPEPSLVPLTKTFAVR